MSFGVTLTKASSRVCSEIGALYILLILDILYGLRILTNEK